MVQSPVPPAGSMTPRHRRRTAAAVLAAVLAAGVAGVAWWAARSPGSSVARGRQAAVGDGSSAPAYGVACRAASGAGPAAALPGLTLDCLGTGPALPLTSLAGRPTIVNLWASWCLPCQRETPRLQRAFTGSGGRVRFVGVDTRDRPGPARDFLHDYRVGYEQLSDPDGMLLARLGVPGLPVTLGLDRAGRVVYRHVGEMRDEDVDEAVRRAA